MTHPGFNVQPNYRCIWQLRKVFVIEIQRFITQTDEEAYAKGLAGYRVSDEVEVALGGNLFVGENEPTQFGQFDNNDNVFARIRYNF